MSLFCICLIPGATFAGATEKESSESAEERATISYRNPLFEKSMADPHVIRVDGKYYLYPTWRGRGYDVSVSDDLVKWEHKGLVFEAEKGGAWAPDVFHNLRGDGKFYLYYTDDNPARARGPENKRVGVAVADSPLGPFEDKGPLAIGAIDGHLFQDDDGELYLYYVKLGGGFKILAQPMADPLTKKGPVTEILRPTEPWEKVGWPVTEGPFMLKREGVYYMMYSGSHTKYPDYAIGYATSKSPTGPFVKHPGNPIAKSTDTIFGPGHHSVVEGPDGNLWMMYHQKVDDSQSFKRFIALDPLWFDEEGVIHTRLSRGLDRPAP